MEKIFIAIKQGLAPIAVPRASHFPKAGLKGGSHLLMCPVSCILLGDWLGDFVSWDGDLDHCVGALGGLIG